MRNSRYLTLALFLGAVSLGRPAFADDKQTAKDLFEQALAKMEAKKYDEACPAIEQSLKLLDERREASLVRGGPLADRVARRLRIRERDGVLPTDVLFDGWIRRATEVRAIFERLIAPVDAPPPWAEDGAPP